MQLKVKMLLAALTIMTLLSTPALCAERPLAVFDVRDFGATGRKSDNAQKAIQAAVDACARAGGGVVELPPGGYTSGTIFLRSHVRFHLDGGATLFASKKRADYTLPAPYTGQQGKGWLNSLLMGVDLEDVTIEGRGIVDGQAEYEWRAMKKDFMQDWLDDVPPLVPLDVQGEIERRTAQPGIKFDWGNRPYYGHITYNIIMALKKLEALGKPLTRSFPAGYERDNPNTWYPHLVVLLRCQDMRISGLSFLRSPSWTMYPYACQRLTIDGVYIHTSRRDGVWADGIDPDGCKDLRISNCTIKTGDDAIVFYSSNGWGPALPCENITITNCRLSSASSAIKFCDGNRNSVRNVTVSNCVITNSNRGIAFMVAQGGYVSNVVLSNLVIDCHRYDWFWWGDGDPIHFMIERGNEKLGQPETPGELPPGSIRNVIIRNVIAHGQGSCVITGHPKSWLKNISIENLRLFISTDPKALYDKAVNAMQFRYAKNLKLKDIEVNWKKPQWVNWRSALYFEDVDGLKVENFSGRPAKPDFPAVVFDKVQDATVRGSQAWQGTQVFLGVKGATSGPIYLVGNELHSARKAYRLEPGLKASTVEAINNF
jgi:polygalacturonase